jgi:hypothetical protein
VQRSGQRECISLMLLPERKKIEEREIKERRRRRPRVLCSAQSVYGASRCSICIYLCLLAAVMASLARAISRLPLPLTPTHPPENHFIRAPCALCYLRSCTHGAPTEKNQRYALYCTRAANKWPAADEEVGVALLCVCSQPLVRSTLMPAMRTNQLQVWKGICKAHKKLQRTHIFTREIYSINFIP